MAISIGPLPISPVSSSHSPPSRKDEMLSRSYSEPIPLPRRFSILKERLVSGKESTLVPSWQRLIQSLSDEVDLVSSLGSQAVPTIDFSNIKKPGVAEVFREGLRQRGVAIIRNVIPRGTAEDLYQGAMGYLDENAEKRPRTPQESDLQELYWSAAQIKARGHPNVLEAQRFVMGLWTSKDPKARVTTNFPITYADRIRTGQKTADTRSPAAAHIDGGSVERWETDGYGRAGTYNEIFQGQWEDYNPWESSTRLTVTSDLYHKAGACSIFRMYQGWLALSPGPSSMRVCPLLKHATAYFLLRPFFSPSSSSSSSPETENWAFTPTNSILHGALPSYAQEINSSIHPHLQLRRSLIDIPDLSPGDYLIWHPDLIHSITSSSPTPSASVMYLPCVPLTQTNALYLSRQRKSFLLGCPGPDFFDGCGYGSGHGRGEAHYIGRPGVQEISDAGGEEGLRAMGLLPWDEEEADTDFEREVLAMANGILFPDLYDMY
ncbi:hypothetical protein QC764_102510 [Podospora pseudoanserina]|uniref:DUF1479 domain protein n=1 Tax=Podospora pseudoanserina TaxID=2609844 RepID=A0ABR0IL27_9PEZI|nr:hypothetical protein QC764_102510 [Podospora pseudoanserina]